MDTVLKTLISPAGKRRVLILRRVNGSFGYEEEFWSDEPLEQCWCSYPSSPYVICDSAETAEREAIANTGWLKATIAHDESPT